MSINIRFPKITAVTEKEQITQIKSYLHQLVEQLNYELQTIGSGNGSAQPTGTYEVQGGEMSYYELRSLIIQELQKVDDMIDDLEHHTSDTLNPHNVTAEQVGARPSTWTPTASDVGAVPTTRKVNGKDLSSDISLTAEDVGARPSTWMPTASDVGARPNTWMPTAEDVGARSRDWMPSASDVGARPNTWTPTAADVGALPAIQDTTYPSCYYIMSSGVKEWINPPMEPGVEYRTTERCNGEPIYRKLVAYTQTEAIGTSGTITGFNIPHGISGFNTLVRLFGRNNANALPYFTANGEWTAAVSVTSTSIMVRTNGTWTSRTWYFDMAYTK